MLCRCLISSFSYPEWINGNPLDYPIYNLYSLNELRREVTELKREVDKLKQENAELKRENAEFKQNNFNRNLLNGLSDVVRYWIRGAVQQVLQSQQLDKKWEWREFQDALVRYCEDPKNQSNSEDIQQAVHILCQHYKISFNFISHMMDTINNRNTMSHVLVDFRNYRNNVAKTLSKIEDVRQMIKSTEYKHDIKYQKNFLKIIKVVSEYVKQPSLSSSSSSSVLGKRKRSSDVLTEQRKQQCDYLSPEQKKDLTDSLIKKEREKKVY
jgi:hypothetical protein